MPRLITANELTAEAAEKQLNNKINEFPNAFSGYNESAATVSITVLPSASHPPMR